jgi:RNA 3'-terminal phosphate cyclase (ATP)
VKLRNIRAGRDKPGLMRQHLTAVRAAAEVGDAEVEGDEVGSQSLSFTPRAIKAGCYTFSVGTAGSGTLVLQTVLPALMIADAPSDVTVEGGTHNQWAPPYDFLAGAYFPLLSRMGVRVIAGLERHGFYPAGGGRFTVGIEPVNGGLVPLELLERGEILHRSFTAMVAHLPRSIAQRELDVAAEKLGWSPNCFHLHDVRNSQGPGNIIIAELHSEHLREVFTGFGRQGARAERVANEVVDQLRDYLAYDAPVGRHLADQLLLPLGIAAWRDSVVSRFKTLALTRHSSTHIAILRMFLGVAIDVGGDRNETTVSIG